MSYELGRVDLEPSADSISNIRLLCYGNSDKEVVRHAFQCFVVKSGESQADSCAAQQNRSLVSFGCCD